MAIPKLFSLARMTTSTTGTGTITLGSAATVNGVTYLTFAQAGVSDGDIVAYGIADPGGASEYGYGTYTSSGTTLTRNVIRSTNSNNAINLGGSAQVFITAGGSDLPFHTLGNARNFSLAASVSGNALTIAIKDTGGADPTALSPVYIDFRSATASTGTTTPYAIRAATSLVISSGSTLGTANSVPFRVWVVLFDDAGTLRVGAINCVTGGATPTAVYPLIEYAVASSTAEGGAGGADSPGVFYTGTAVSSKAYRIIGFMEWSSGLGTAGTWASGPTTIQVFGPGLPRPCDIVQRVRTSTSTSAGGTTTMPTNARPVNTDGTEFMSLAITPVSACNILRIETQAQLAVSNATVAGSIALFQDSTSNSLAAADFYAGSANNTEGPLFLEYELTAATTSSTTFKVRGGATTGNCTFSSRFNNTVSNNWILIHEIMV